MFSDELINKIEESTNKMLESFNKGGKLLICGNGGSAADSQHFATELVSKFNLERKALPAIALTTNTSTLTAIGNDHGSLTIFSRQIEALGAENDILFIISTSGNSKNILEAIKIAKEKNIYTIGLTGKTGGKIQNICNLTLNCPSEYTPRIQECHILIIHIICDIIEKHFYEKQSNIFRQRRSHKSRQRTRPQNKRLQILQ